MHPWLPLIEAWFDASVLTMILSAWYTIHHWVRL